MAFWEKVRKDIEKGFREGISAIREKAEVLTEEGKRKYRVFDLKSKAHKLMADLGGLVYGLSTKTKNPMQDARVKAAIEKIKKLEGQIAKLESPAGKKKAARKKTRKKTTSKKRAQKAAPAA